MKDRKKPDKFLLPHRMPSDDREFAFSSRVFPKASQIKAPYKLWHYQDTKWPMPPDLAVEVISLNDLFERVYAKVLEYLAAGVKQVWLVSPEHHTVTIYRAATNITAFPGDSELVSEDLFPGFHCPLREIFTSPVQTPPSSRQ